jgi:hypothetical protein
MAGDIALSGDLLRRGRDATTPLKTAATEHRPSLRRTKWNRRRFAALRACGLRLRPWIGRTRAAIAVHHRNSLGFTDFAPLGFILELLVVKELLFTGSENKFRTAIHTRQSFVLEIHLEKALP